MRAAIASLSLLASAVPVCAQSGNAAEEPPEPTREFSIPAQPLSQALRQYAQQSGDQVVFYSSIGQGRESAAVVGRYTRQEALQTLLENTGLQQLRVNPNTVAIRSAPRSAPGKTRAALQRTSADAPALPAHTGEAPAVRRGRQSPGLMEHSLLDVEEIIVTGTAVPERTKFASSVAISTFDADDIAQQAPTSPAALISAVPGFWVESTSGSTQGNVFARGIIQDGGYRYVGLMEDGIALYPVFELSFYNPDQLVRVDETVARVEALRGGTSPIFTAGAVGGSVNFVTRSPGEAVEAIFKPSFSDYGTYRGDVSWSGPLGADWGAAFGGYYRRTDGVRNPGYTADEGGQFRVKLARGFAAGDLELFAKYIDDRSLFAVPIPLTGDPAHPRGLHGADPGTYSLHSQDLARAGLPPSAAEVGLQGSDLEDGIHPQVGTAGARLTVQVNEVVSLVNLIRYTGGEVRFDGMFPGGVPVSGADYAASRGVDANYTVLASGTAYPAAQLVQNHGHWVVNKEYEALQDDVRLNLSLGPHALTGGLYLADYSMEDRWSLGNLLLTDVSDRPRRLSLPGVTDPRGFTRYSFFNLIADYDATAYALYAADEWQLGERLRLDAGARLDAEQIEGSISQAVEVDLDGNPATPWDNATSRAGSARRRVDEDFSNFSWSIGFNYEFTDRHAFFGRYTHAAKLPHFDDLRNDQARKDPVTNVELGYKTALDSLVIFATLFQTEFDNVSFADISSTGEPVPRQAGTRTRGVELEAQLRPLPALDVRVSLTWQDPQYRNFTGSQIDNTGNRIRRIPALMGRITPTYSFLDGRGRAFLTYAHVAQRYANDENTIKLPPYDKLDAGVMFDFAEGWTVQISGDNLTGEVGLTEGNPRTDVGAGGIGAIYMARPLFARSITGSITRRY